MVMAGIESMPGAAPNDISINRLQWLQQRKAIIEEKLLLKNNELKSLCIEEAELTGVLPVEIPLEPGETPPIIRKKVLNLTSDSQSLMTKSQAHGSEESTLELERQIQVGLVEASLAILNDVTENNKTLKKKQRAIYQQSQRRIQELDAQLNFLRLSHGGGLKHTQSHLSLHESQPHLPLSAKHRTKKPRPPLDTIGSKNLHEQGGISLSPLNSEHNYNFYMNQNAQDVSDNSHLHMSSRNSNRHSSMSESPIDQQANIIKYPDYQVNNNNNYFSPDHFRNRSYTQSVSKNIQAQKLHDLSHRTVPNTFSEEERQLQRLLRLKKQESDELRHQRYPNSKILDEAYTQLLTNYQEDRINFDSQLNNMTISNANQYSANSIQKDQNNSIISTSNSIDYNSKAAIDTYIPPGYWVRLGGEIVWCTDEELNNEKFGSLDRRKNVLQHPSNFGPNTRFYTVAGSSGRNQSNNNPKQSHPSLSHLEKTTPPNKVLIRTQSLGNVETWNQAQDIYNHDFVDSSKNKSKEKEWVETSLDASSKQDSGLHPYNVNKYISQHSSSSQSIKDTNFDSQDSVKSASVLLNKRNRERELNEPSLPKVLLRQQQNFIEHRMLEIPAESKKLDNGNDSMLPLSSPTNHTVIQPGKYQPYREEIKPFEMSDFYKYSTKFRKRVESGNVDDPRVTSTKHVTNIQNNSRELMPSVHRNSSGHSSSFTSR